MLTLTNVNSDQTAIQGSERKRRDRGGGEQRRTGGRREVMGLFMDIQGDIVCGLIVCVLPHF